MRTRSSASVESPCETIVSKTHSPMAPAGSQRRRTHTLATSAPASTMPAPDWNEYRGSLAFTSV